MLAGVVPATVGAMRDLGAREITAHVGPSVCGRCYEVPLPMQQDALARVPESGARTWTGTPRSTWRRAWSLSSPPWTSR